MAMQTYQCSDRFTFVDNAAAATITLTLPTPSAGTGWIIDSVWIYALGALTVHDLEILKNDGTTKIARSGGQVTAAALPIHVAITGPIATKSGDAPKVVYTATGATAVQCTVNARLASAS